MNYNYQIKKSERGMGYQIVRIQNRGGYNKIIHSFIDSLAEAESVVRMLRMFDSDDFWRFELGWLYDQVRFGVLSDEQLVDFVAKRVQNDESAMVECDRTARRMRVGKYATREEMSAFSSEMRPHGLREMAYWSSMGDADFKVAVLKRLGFDLGDNG